MAVHFFNILMFGSNNTSTFSKSLATQKNRGHLFSNIYFCDHFFHTVFCPYFPVFFLYNPVFHLFFTCISFIIKLLLLWEVWLNHIHTSNRITFPWKPRWNYSQSTLKTCKLTPQFTSEIVDIIRGYFQNYKFFPTS